MFEHVLLDVTDLERSRSIYEAALGALDLTVQHDSPKEIGFGSTRPDTRLWLRERGSPGGGVHLAFSAATRAAVDAFHSNALAAGASDNGPPGIREQYNAGYYAAYFLDPDGNNIEAVRVESIPG
jgi:catechol 2,3-dioxygenase-like lactoylglutathione lyase family enzyme